MSPLYDSKVSVLFATEILGGTTDFIRPGNFSGTFIFMEVNNGRKNFKSEKSAFR